MRTRSTTTLAFATALFLVSAIPAAATFHQIVWQEIKLGSRHKAKVIQYTGATMISKTEFVYTAKADGQARSVIYIHDPAKRSISVTITGGTAPLMYHALVNNEVLKEVQLELRSGGRLLATATQRLAREAGSGMATGLYYPKSETYDSLSMDVLLHLPSEFAGTRPQDLFGEQITEAYPSGAGKVFKTLLDIVSGGFKYQRDCETTTSGPSYSCSAACVEASEGGAGPQCPCSFCGTICCGGTCTQTEGTTTRNCSATVEIGPQG